MKNKLMDLNDHLFLQIERLNDEDLKGEEMTIELNRSKGLANLAAQVINNAKLALDGYKAINDGLIKRAPQMLGMKEPEDV